MLLGGGAFCSNDDSGVEISLFNSGIGINYQLKNGANNIGSAINGTGSAISFGHHLEQGIYTVVATNANNGCSQTMTSSAVVTVNSAPSANITVTNNCGNSVFNLALSLSGVGDSFLWSNAATTEDITVSTAGTYSVTVTNADGCTATANGIATPSTPPIAYAITGGGDLCSNDDGGVEIGLANSAIGVSYQLKNGANNIGSPMDGTDAALSFGNHLEPGVYTIVATNTSNGCTLTMTNSVTITVHPYPTMATTVTNNCGNAVLSVSGTGTSYVWSNGMTGASITVATAGVYSVTATGAGGCKKVESITAAPKTGVTINITAVNNCGNSVLNLTTSPLGAGGNFLWSNAATTEDITVSTTGDYSVTVSNADGCSATASGTAAPISATTASIAVTNNCGNSVINLTTNATSYLWSNEATTEDITVSTAGDYSVTVTNGGACTAVASGTVAPKTATTASIAVTDNCGNSVLNLTTNGTDFLWSNAATTEDITVSTTGDYSVTVSNADGCSATASGTAAPISATTASIAVTNNCGNSVINLTTNATSYLWSNAATTEDITVSTAGDYSVTVTNGGACTAVASGTVAPKTAMTASIAVMNNCGNSALNLTISPLGAGGNFLWSNAATTEDITVSTTGDYSVTVSNADGCMAAASGTAVPLSSATVYNITGGGTYCAGLDGVEIGLDGSQIGVSYQLKRGTVNVGTAITGTGSAISFGKQLTAGTYNVVATISGSCTNMMQNPKTITVTTTLPAFVNSSVPANVTVNCNAVPAAATPTTTSSCSTVSFAETSTQGTDSNECSYYNYVITRTWTATDKRGNTATKSQVITVTNKIAPTFGTVANVTVTENTIPTTVPYNLNSCGAPATLSFTETRTDLTPLACQSYQFVLNRVWTVTDVCGNTSTKTQKITARGIRLTCPADKNLKTNTDGKTDYNCATIVAASNGVAPQFLDNCNVAGLTYAITGATSLSGSGTVAGLNFNKGISTVTYSLTSGTSTESCSFNINIEDLELPKITTVTQNVIDACDIPNPLPSSFDPTMTDNCSGTLTLEVANDVTANVAGCSSKTATLKYTKSLTRTWKVTDASGNTVTKTQIIYIRDMVAPTAVPKTLEVFVGNTNVVLSASSFDLSSSDNCTPSANLQYRACLGGTCTTLGTSITLSKSQIPTGQNQITIPVKFQVWDACSNKSTIVQTSVTLKRATTMGAEQNGSLELPQVSDNDLVTPTETSTVDASHGSLKCYPNPFSEDLNLEFNLTQDVERLTLKVYDNQGRLVETNERGEALAGYYQMRWNLSRLTSGMYHICLELDGKCIRTERVIMMK